MIKRLLFSAFLVIISIYGHAHSTDSSTYILLKSGEHVFGNSLEVKKKSSSFLFWKWSDHRIFLDNKEYNVDRVRLICDRPDPCIAVIKDVSRYNEPDFAERIRKGELNLYRATIETYRASAPAGGSGMSQVRKVTSNAYFYNRGLGEMKRANYRNLYKEYRHHSQARSDLNKSLLSATGEYAFKHGFLAAYLAHYTNVLFFTDDYFFDHFFLIHPYDDPLANMALNFGIYAGTVVIGSYLGKLRDRLFIRSIETYNAIDFTY